MRFASFVVTSLFRFGFTTKLTKVTKKLEGNEWKLMQIDDEFERLAGSIPEGAHTFEQIGRKLEQYWSESYDAPQLAATCRWAAYFLGKAETRRPAWDWILAKAIRASDLHRIALGVGVFEIMAELPRIRVY